MIPSFSHERMARVVTDERFQQEDVVLLRPTFGTMTLGIQKASFALISPIRCLVQPASPDDLKLLEEGQRVGNIKAVWSTVPLYVANAKDRDSDVLKIGGVHFTVIKMLDRSPNGYHKVLAEGYVHG